MIWDQVHHNDISFTHVFVFVCVCVMSVCAYVKVCSSSQATFSNPSTAPPHPPFSNADGSSMLQMISAATTAREPFAVDPCHIFVLLPPSLIPSLPLSLPLSVLLILYKFQFEFFGQANYLIIFHHSSCNWKFQLTFV